MSLRDPVPDRYRRNKEIEWLRKKMEEIFQNLIR
jgi:hypothetical protein